MSKKQTAITNSIVPEPKRFLKMQEAIDVSYIKGRAESADQLKKLADQNKSLIEELEKSGELVFSMKSVYNELLSEFHILQTKIGLPVRQRLPDTRQAVTHKFTVGGHEGYMTVGMFPNGMPGELFIMMAKEGSTVGGLMDTIGTLTSIALQYGVSLEILSDKFMHQRFEPSGFTPNPEIRMASSIIDYVFRWMRIYFGREASAVAIAPAPVQPPVPVKKIESAAETQVMPEAQSDNPPCYKCGTIMQRAGKCHRCPNCGETSGCS